MERKVVTQHSSNKENASFCPEGYREESHPEAQSSQGVAQFVRYHAENHSQQQGAEKQQNTAPRRRVEQDAAKDDHAKKTQHGETEG
jgi:hypothetical protein